MIKGLLEFLRQEKRNSDIAVFKRILDEMCTIDDHNPA
ncbi:MAG: hypothetical protein ACJAX4_002899 [Clostridium sp.]|jgi:hypothetical protein